MKKVGTHTQSFGNSMSAMILAFVLTILCILCVFNLLWGLECG